MQAAFCRTCGVRLAETEDVGLDAGTLAGEPTRTPLEFRLCSAPQSAYGLIWMLFDHGILASFNPHSRSSIGRLQQVAALWQGTRSHTFAVRELSRSGRGKLTERFALVASESSLDARGLVSGRELNFGACLPGETILCDSPYRRIEGKGDRLYCLTARDGQLSLLIVNPFSGQAERVAIPVDDERICGPVLWRETVLVWSKSSVWTIEGSSVARHAMPAGVSLWTSPDDADRVRLPLAATPVMLQADGVYLPGTRYGAAILLRMMKLRETWVSGVVTIGRDGVLTADRTGQPVLVTDGHLLSCVGQSFRELESAEALSGQFTAYVDDAVRVFFCQGDAGGRQHEWLRARSREGDLPVTWRLQPGRTLKECAGFWSVDGSLTAQVFTDGETQTQELFAWSA